MEEIEKKEELVEEAPKIDIEEILKSLKEEGLSDEEIDKALKTMVEEGKIGEDDYVKAHELLENGANEEKAEAEKLFGLKFVK